DAGTVVTEPRHHERASGCRRRHREVDAAGQHDESLPRGDQAEDGRIHERCRELRQRQERVPGLCAVDDVRSHEQGYEDEREHHHRVVREDGGDVERTLLRLGGNRRHPPLPFWRMASPPTMTTRTMMVPWMTSAQLLSTPFRIRSVFTSVSTNAPMIGPMSPPTPPRRETPPSTTAATLFSV